MVEGERRGQGMFVKDRSLHGVVSTMGDATRPGNEYRGDSVLTGVTGGIGIDVEQLNELDVERGFL